MRPRITPSRLELDYVARPTRAAWPGVLLLAGALAVAAQVLLSYRDVQLELASRAATVNPAAAQPAASRQSSRLRIDEEAKNTETVLRQLGLPWAGLIETVEAAASADIALLQMQPDALQRTLRLSAEARHHGAMFEYLRRLAAAPTFAEVHLVSHQVQLEDPQRPVQFSLQAALRSAP